MDQINILRPPLYVDLDGTFIKSDILIESLVKAIKANPLIFIHCLIWLFQGGRALLKSNLASIVDIDTQSLPINPDFFQFLQDEKKAGRKIILATASARKFAQQIVEESTIFDDFISSDNAVNLKGDAKLKKIQEVDKLFSYAGNAPVDFDIFKSAKESFLVNPDSHTLKLIQKQPVTKTFDIPKHNKTKKWIKQFRLHQWLKNLLIFVPLMVSGLFTNIVEIGLSFAAFVSFSLLASSTYVLNDILDLDSDRRHPRKRNRPIAAGLISVVEASSAASILFILSFIIALFTSTEYTISLFCYLILTLSYSFKIKQYIGMDVVMLALLYTVRIIAGAYAIGVNTSFWLLAFSIFIFLSLALVKRCSEIHSLKKVGKEKASGRDYMVDDYSILQSFGTASAMIAVLMFAFYINVGTLTAQYQQPDILWLIIPALSYWLMRMWIKTHRGDMHDDPIIFSLKDRGSLVTISFCVLISLLAQLL